MDILAFKQQLDLKKCELQPCTSGGCAILLPSTPGAYENLVPRNVKNHTSRMQTTRLAEEARTNPDFPHNLSNDEACSDQELEPLLQSVEKRTLAKEELIAKMTTLDEEIRNLHQEMVGNTKKAKLLSDLKDASKIDHEMRAVKFRRFFFFKYISYLDVYSY